MEIKFKTLICVTSFPDNPKYKSKTRFSVDHLTDRFSDVQNRRCCRMVKFLTVEVLD